MPALPSSAPVRVFAICICFLGATAATASDAAWRAWAQDENKGHALAGRVYDVASGKLSDPADGPRPLPEGLVLLGEVHDNPVHHRLRGWLIAETLRAHPDRRPAVVVE